MTSGLMCPHCGALVDVEHGLTAPHEYLWRGQACPGTGQNPRCAESDGRPLWNGARNPHFAPQGGARPRQERALTGESLRSVVLCEETGQQATEDGWCSVHGSDGCLYAYRHPYDNATDRWKRPQWDLPSARQR